MNKRTDYDAMTVAELERELREAFFLTDKIDESLSQELERIREALERKRPTEYRHTPEEAWERFCEENPEALAALGAAGAKKPKAGRRGRTVPALVRRALIAAALLLLLAGAVLGANRFGLELRAWVPGQEGGSVRFRQIEAGTGTTILGALEELGIHEPVYPGRLPEGFVLTESQISAEPLLLFEAYGDGERWLTVTITPVSALEVALYQEQNEPVRQYLAGEAEHYLFSNAGAVTAVWYTENYFTSVSGNISVEEMKKIIDSVCAR